MFVLEIICPETICTCVGAGVTVIEDENFVVAVLIDFESNCLGKLTQFCNVSCENSRKYRVGYGLIVAEADAGICVSVADVLVFLIEKIALHYGLFFFVDVLNCLILCCIKMQW